MSGPVTILIARHGETEWNLQRRFQGHGDSPLTDRGREQSRRLAERLSRETLHAVYSSDLGRACATAEIVAQPHELMIRTSPELREIDCGEWTGQARADLALREPASVERYRLTPWQHRMPGGETLAMVQKRALTFVRGLAAEHAGERVAIITHHIVVETLLVHAQGLSLEDLWLETLNGNCYLSVLQLERGELRPLIVHDGDHLGDANHPHFESGRVA